MRLFPALKLRDLIRRNSNNLDLVRLGCACFVIYGHASLIVVDPAFPNGLPDVSQWLGYPGIYSASIAVKVFFFISGLLVTNSLLTHRSIRHFVVTRILRIWPALIVVLVVSAFVIGPLFSILDPRQYFSYGSVYHYVIGNILMMAPDYLPGIFADNALALRVNGALWSLSYEIAAYISILLLGISGVLRSTLASAVPLGLVVLALALPPLWPLGWASENPQISYLPFCFAFGALLAVLKDKVTLSLPVVTALWIIFLLLVRTQIGPTILFTSLFVSLLYVSGLPAVLRLRLPFDLSYGTFLWGFVIQQMLAALWPHRSLMFHLPFSLGLALVAGFFSWRFVEKPAQQLSKKFSDSVFPAKDCLAGQESWTL